MVNYKVWFIADLHFGHESILKFTQRPIVLSSNINEHDDLLVYKWNKTIAKQDHVYILGDLSFKNAEDTRKILEKLNGKKHLIIGNHDKSADSEINSNYFVDKAQILDVRFKKENFPFLVEDFKVNLCHYPICSWNGKNHGVSAIHGHCHGKYDNLNTDSEELRVDVGLDGKLADYNFVSLERLYNHFLKVAKKHCYQTVTEYGKYKASQKPT